MIDDLIGRAEAQTAIQFAAKRYTVAHEAHGEGQVVWSDNLINVTDAMNVLRDLPSIQPERKTVFNRDIAIEAICDEVMLWFDVSATKAYEIAETAVKRIEVRMEKTEKGEQE